MYSVAERGNELSPAAVVRRDDVPGGNFRRGRSAGPPFLTAVYRMMKMRKHFLGFVVCLAFVACSSLAAFGASRSDEGTPGAAKTPAAANRESAVAKIGELCQKLKETYSDRYRERTPDEFDAAPDSELAAAEREYFNQNCDQVFTAFAEYSATGNDESYEEMTRALGEVRFYQSKSPYYAELTACVGEQFSLPNFYVEASERFLSAMTRRTVAQNFSIQEYIRSAFARGSGVAHGYTSIELRPNADRAEMAVVLNARVLTNTIGTSRGVDVHSDNYGNVVASKSIFINSNGVLTTTPGVASGNMKTNVNSFDANRFTPFGGAIIQSKIYQELPFSELESTNRVNRRVAAELERETNEQVFQLNQRLARFTQNCADPMVRNLTTRTSETRLFCSFILGQSSQLAAPANVEVRAARYMRKRSGEVGIARSNAPRFAVAETNESYSRRFVPSQTSRPIPMTIPRKPATVAAGAPTANIPYAPQYQQGPLASLICAPLSIVSEIASTLAPGAVQVAPIPANQAYAGSASAPARPQISNVPSIESTLPPSDGKLDLIARVHQSGPTNIATTALAGAVVGTDSDSFDAVLSRFPGVDPNEMKRMLAANESNLTVADDPNDAYKNVSIEFDDVRPFVARFSDGKIATVLHISSCVADGAAYPPAEVHFVYGVEKRGDSYAFVRESFEVMPEGYQDGDSVSARFHTFRRVFMKRLEKAVQEEYVVGPISLDDANTGERRGALIPDQIDAQNGWLTLGFRYDPTYAVN